MNTKGCQSLLWFMAIPYVWGYGDGKAKGADQTVSIGV
jgi:hypothetical protein